jgi:hypothetical protein
VPAARNLGPDRAFPNGGWKTWASDRFVSNWGLFLARPDARQDASYASIKAIYESVRGRAATSDAHGDAASKGAAQTEAKKPKKRRRKVE